MGKDYVVALDQGTTSSRAVLVDKRGKIVAAVQKPFYQHIIGRYSSLRKQSGSGFTRRITVRYESNGRANIRSYIAVGGQAFNISAERNRFRLRRYLQNTSRFVKYKVDIRLFNSFCGINRRNADNCIERV